MSDDAALANARIDEWKRRAEAAEEDLKIALRNNQPIAEAHLEWLEMGHPRADIDKWKRMAGALTEYDGDVVAAAVAMGAAPPDSPEAGAFRARMDRESGPGIAPLNLDIGSERLAFLDEDLLCEDAT